jgi:hypothetical protein
MLGDRGRFIAFLSAQIVLIDGMVETAGNKTTEDIWEFGLYILQTQH